MKTITKHLLALAALVCIQAPLCAYQFTFANKTGRDLLLMIYASTDKGQYAVIKKDKSHTFNNENWGPEQCLTNATAIRGESLYSPFIDAFTILFINNGPFCGDATFVLKEEQPGTITAIQKNKQKNGNS